MKEALLAGGLRNSDSEEPIRAIIQGQIAPGKISVAIAQLNHHEEFSQIGIVQEGVCWSKKWWAFKFQITKN